ncbi:MAG TPA: 50S ribosomal protein L18 [Phycisphaerales bacterium]|nr:50S ribosomal protein L18 [Phycisphaerales bacterium]HCD30949.1 50S ribosomal protein L18 [Phycisphaerales bacterium]|tara:strand:- start:1065 stop:1421 length:357 start_codon:yes stop_codon:yes gene_type:complete
MKPHKIKTLSRNRRKSGTRKKVFGDAQRPRLTVYRSLKQIYAQIIDDMEGKTLVSWSSQQAKAAAGGNIAAATEVGKQLAEKAVAAGITKVQFDRNGFKYHGRVKALADGAREGGLKF